MNQNKKIFIENEVVHELKHYLPSQSPLRDFIHHNTLHAFQNLKFYDALHTASKMFGYKTNLSLTEYREFYDSNKIKENILDKIISERKGINHLQEWKDKVLYETLDASVSSRIGLLRANWKKEYHIDLDLPVHPILFRILCAYLDQGISIWNFPVYQKTFLQSVKELEQNSFSPIFKTKRAAELIQSEDLNIKMLLDVIVGDETLYKQYLFDQQFAHQGWSGMVSIVEDSPESLMDKRNISLRDVIIFELLLEIEMLDNKFGETWLPLAKNLTSNPENIFDEVKTTEFDEVISILHDAYEWSFYDEVLAGIQNSGTKQKNNLQESEITSKKSKTFQALFCIDDRECSLRRYLEILDPKCETYGTPGFFNVEFYYKPENGKFLTKLCPPSVTPKYLIKEIGTNEKRPKDAHFTKHTHSLIQGWFISQTLGFWSAFRLFLNIFKPTMSPATVSSFRHMDKYAQLTFENSDTNNKEDGLQIGFTVDEMVQRVEGLLRSIGLIENFSPTVYVVGHGSSSVNNTYYAGYDCGACSGRPGSVNARVICAMANHYEVRKLLKNKGIDIPYDTKFIGALHDTTRDEILFFDENALSPIPTENHFRNETIFLKALDLNSKERSRRFESIDSKLSAHQIHKKILIRSVSLFEPRPEYNHATNALCIVGRRELTENIFLDRRSFLNSYNYKIDPEGELLFNIIRPLGPVCGGINLEYFFSRVDNHKLGAGTKLPHNVMGLFGVANGADGDLRPGLPSQMVEIHDPVRLLMIIEQFPNVVLNILQKSAQTYEWFINEWIHLVVVNPENKELFHFRNGDFVKYHPLHRKNKHVYNVALEVESSNQNLPIQPLT